MVNISTVSHVLEVQADEIYSVGLPGSTIKEDLYKSWEIDGTADIDDHANFDRSKFEEEISFNEGRYSVPLPFLEGSMNSLPLNRYQLEKRLGAMMGKLKSNPTLFARYDDVIRTQEKDGKIERAS